MLALPKDMKASALNFRRDSVNGKVVWTLRNGTKKIWAGRASDKLEAHVEALHQLIQQLQEEIEVLKQKIEEE